MMPLHTGSKLIFSNRLQPICQRSLFNNPNEIGYGQDLRVLPDQRLTRQLLAGEQLHNKAVDLSAMVSPKDAEAIAIVKLGPLKQFKYLSSATTPRVTSVVK